MTSVSSIIAAGLFLTAFVSGCSTVNPAHTQSGFDLHSFRTAYVVTHGGNSSDMDSYLQAALIDRGLQVRAGPEAAKPSDVDFYVIYSDSWRWDLTMYLKSLQIQFYETKTNTLMASGSFSNSLLHSFPNPSGKVNEVIATMYGDRKSD